MRSVAMNKTFSNIAVFLAYAFFLNLVWEILQVPLYRGTTLLWDTFTAASLSDQNYWSVLLYATLGDVVYISLIWALIAFLERDISWLARPMKNRVSAYVIMLGLLLSTLIEWRGLGSGHWSYSVLMPIVPFLDIGWSPFIQLAATGRVSFFLFRRFDTIGRLHT